MSSEISKICHVLLWNSIYLVKHFANEILLWGYILLCFHLRKHMGKWEVHLLHIQIMLENSNLDQIGTSGNLFVNKIVYTRVREFDLDQELKPISPYQNESGDVTKDEDWRKKETPLY